MKQGSAILRVLIGAVIILAAEQGAAQGVPTLDHVTAVPGPTAQMYFGSLGFSDYGEWGGSNTVDDRGQPDSPPWMICQWVASTKTASCNLHSPPPMAVNGCSMVPDSLIVNGIPASSLGNIFTAACNNHDRCYGTLDTNKSDCDMLLGYDMLQIARDNIAPSQWAYYEPHVKLQSAAYSSFLQSSVGKLVSGGKFDAAQSEGLCRSFSAWNKQYQCGL